MYLKDGCAVHHSLGSEVPAHTAAAAPVCRSLCDIELGGLAVSDPETLKAARMPWRMDARRLRANARLVASAMAVTV